MYLHRLVLAAVMSAGILPATQAAVISSTSQGTVGYGYDSAGLFGAVGANLQGLSYSMTISFDRALNQDYHHDDSYYNYYYNAYSYSYGSAPATVSLTVNNVNYSTILDPSSGYGGYSQNFIANGLSLYGQNPNYWYSSYDQLYGGASTYGSDWYVDAYHYVYSHTDAFVGPNRDLDASYSRTVENGDSFGAYFSFYNYGNSMSTYLSLTPISVALNGNAVPEPESLALFGIGLLGLAVRRRSARKNIC